MAWHGMAWRGSSLFLVSFFFLLNFVSIVLHEITRPAFITKRDFRVSLVALFLLLREIQPIRKLSDLPVSFFPRLGLSL